MGFVSDFLSKFFSSSSDYYMYGTPYVIGQKGAVWIETCKPYQLYNEIPQLRAVVDRKASMFSNMDLKLINIKDGSEVKDEQLHTLLQNPNALHGLNSWLKEAKTQEQIYGNLFIYKNKPSKIQKYPTTLSNVSASYVKPILTGKVFDQVSIDGIISGYEYQEQSTTKIFATNDILYIRIADVDNPVIGQSPLVSLKFPLTNTKLAYEYRNVIMGELGAPKIISSNGKDSIGDKSWTTEEKQDIEKAFTTDYGVGKGKGRVKIVPGSIQVTDNAFPTKDLMLFEEVEADMLTIVDHFGMNINLFSNKSATFENIKNAIIQTYQDTIIPEADQFTQALSKFIGVPNGTRLIASYDHLSIMQENKQKGMGAIATIISALNQAVSSGILRQDQAAKILANELATQLSEI